MADETEGGTNGGTKDPYLELEYKECLASTRYTSDIRFNYFASFVTFFGILVGAYYLIWISEAKVVAPLKPWIMLGVSVFGLFMAFIALMIETRNRATLRACARHATLLESEMTPILYGERMRRLRLREMMETPETINRVFGIDATHGRAIMITYRVIFGIWLGLIAFSANEIMTLYPAL